MKDLFTVALFTGIETIKKKTFIVTNIIIIIGIILFFNLPKILDVIFNEEDIANSLTTLIVDSENIYENSLEVLNELEFTEIYEIENDSITEEEIKILIEDEEINNAVVITEENNIVNFKYIAKNEVLSDNLSNTLVIMESIYKELQINNLNLTEEEYLNINPSFNIERLNLNLDELDGANDTDIEFVMILSTLLFMAIYLFAFQVSSSVTTEKTSKIVETLVTSTSSKNIILGKTIGIGLVGLCQLLTLIFIAFIASIIFPTDMYNELFSFSIASPIVLIITLLYFILGYLLYAFLFALTGATVSRTEDIQMANTPVTIIVIVSFYLSYFSMMDPTSSLSQLSSILPISSAFSMPLRVLMGLASPLEIILSIGILIATISLIAFISIRIYSNAILNAGNQKGIKNLIKLFKQKDDV